MLKEFMRLDYRKLSALLQDTPSLAATIGLDSIPHFTTFQKAHDRLLGSRRVKRLLDETVDGAIKHKLMKRKVKRKQKTAGKKGHKRRRFPKAGFVGDCQTHFILAVVPVRGPMPDDKHFQPALKRATGKARIEALLADAGQLRLS